MSDGGHFPGVTLDWAISRRMSAIGSGAASCRDALLIYSWQEGPTWQQHTYMTFEMLHIDKEFFITTGGTTVFQVGLLRGDQRGARFEVGIRIGVAWVQSATREAYPLTTIQRTSLGQHILNGITWVLLTRGKSATLPDILRFIGGGMQGALLSTALLASCLPADALPF